MSKSRKPGRLFIILALFVCVGVCLVILKYGRRPARTSQQVAGETIEVITHSVETPAEEKPTNTYAWKGANTDPKIVRIAQARIEGYVQRVGIDQFGAIATPNNIHKAGWFVDSTPPGQTGLTIIGGHLDGVTAPDGIFAQLHQVTIGMEVGVMLGSGNLITYRVTAVSEVSVADAGQLLYSKDPQVRSQLNLITCAGNFNVADKNYEKRVIVSAVLVE